MINAPSYKSKQIFLVIIKLSIVVGASYYIYYELMKNDYLKFNDFVDFLIKKGFFSLKNIIFLLFLSIINWFLEIKKWQNLVSCVVTISFISALKQSLAALTASIITPNRIGDYAAKAVYFGKTIRKRILLLNLLSNMAQMSVTLIFGVVGLLLFAQRFDIPISSSKLIRGISIIVIVLLTTYFTIGQKRFAIRGFNLTNIINFVRNIPKGIHVKNVLYSVLRYLVFSFQFYYLLLLFGVEVNYFNAMIVITSVYLISSVVPTIFLLDVVVKGSAAIFLFNMVGVNSITVLSVVTTMWLLNFVLPSLFGSFFVLKFKWHQGYASNSY